MGYVIVDMLRFFDTYKFHSPLPDWVVGVEELVTAVDMVVLQTLQRGILGSNPL